MPATALRIAVLLGLGLVLVPVPGCGDDEGSGDRGEGSCGDGVCSSTEDCETPLRCADDCGTCVGDQCTTTGTKGSCGQPCNSSCDCVHSAEVCTADYGEAEGQCVPVSCLDCQGFAQCNFTPDADAFCSNTDCG